MKAKLTLLCFILIAALGLRAQFTDSVSSITCFGQCNGAITMSPNNWVYKYAWSTGDTAVTISSLCAGTYTCTVICDTTNQAVDTLSIVVYNPAPININIQSTNADCQNFNGTATATVFGGTPPYIYTWSGGSGASTPTLTSLDGGIYGLTVMDNNGCIATQLDTVFTINVYANTASTTPSACGQCNGGAVINIYGTATPHYLWNGYDTSSSPILCPGPNTLVVTNGHPLCASSLTVIVPSVTSMTVSSNVTGFITCSSPASVTATISGANITHTFMYNWGDHNINWGDTTLTHLYTSPGTYYIEVIDTNTACTSTTSTTIYNNGLQPSIYTTITPVCTQLHSGEIVATAYGGTLPYTYHWNTGINRDTLGQLSPGNYVVTVTDSTGCTATATTTLTATNGEQGYYVYTQSTPTNCTIANGTTTAVVLGGVSPYTYSWSTGLTTDTARGLPQGTYYLTVTDANGCQVQARSLVTTSCHSFVTGYVYVDTNNNCIKDVGESPLSCLVTASNGTTSFYATADASGYYSINITDTGYYIITPSLYSGYCGHFTPCGSGFANVTHLGDTIFNQNFGLRNAYNADLTIHPGWTSVNPGFIKEYWVMPYNQSPYSFLGTATVVFTYDSALVYQSSFAPLPVHDPVMHTLTWQVSNVPYPNYDWNGRFRNFFLVPASVSPGYQLQSSFYITPTAGDCDPANNLLTFSETTLGSHDPNEKKVEPAGAILETDSVLTYTISFQNTGTAATNFIIVKDTLSPYLDPATVVNIASSAPYKFEITGRGILTWTFNPLALPDSIADPDGSKGFVKFSVKKKANLPIGSSISNRASIYFDYNDGVVTNTVADTMTNPLSIIESYADASVSVRAYPNPFSEATTIVVSGIRGGFGFELYDMSGRKVQSTQIATDQLQVQRDGLASGVYLYRVTAHSGQTAYGKLIAK